MPADQALHVVVDAINANAELRGPDRYLLSLLEQLARIQPGCHFNVCHAPWQQAVRNAVLPENVQLTELKPPRNALARALWHATVFPKWADSQNADVVFLPNIIYAPGMRTPSIMTVHDLAHFRFPEKFGFVKGRLQTLLIRLALKKPRKLIAVSQFTLNDLERFAGICGDRVVEIGEGAPAPVYRLSEPAGPPVLLCVGRTEKSKNVEFLVDSFAASPFLAERGARLLIVGTPGNAEHLVRESIARAGPARIERLGFVSEEELQRLYTSATAFVFPSLMEGFGLVLLEAMAFGAPVVAMNASAVPSVVGDAAILVDADGPDDLRREMERIVSDRCLRDDLRRRGYERLAQHSWVAVAEQIWRQLKHAKIEAMGDRLMTACDPAGPDKMDNKP